jgi:hypothetical protein
MMGDGVDQVARALFVGEARRKADHPLVAVQAGPRAQRRHPFRGRIGDDHRRQDHPHLAVQETGEEGRMPREVLGVGHDGIGQPARQQVVPKGQPVYDLAVPDGRHLEVAVIGQDRPVARPAARAHVASAASTCGRWMLTHLVRAHLAPCEGSEGGHEDGLVEPEEATGTRTTRTPSIISSYAKLPSIVRGEHCDLVASARPARAPAAPHRSSGRSRAADST